MRGPVLAATASTLILSYLTHPSTVRLILGVTLVLITTCLPESMRSLFRFPAALVGRPDQVTRPYLSKGTDQSGQENVKLRSRSRLFQQFSAFNPNTGLGVR